MKLDLAPSALLAVLALANCAPGTFGTDVTRDLPEQTIPGDPASHAAAVALMQAAPDAPLPTLSFSIASDAIDTSGLSGIYLRGLALTITPTAEAANDTDCWDFVQSVAIFVESTRQGSTLPRVLIAQGGAPGCVRTMDVTPAGNVDIKPYTDEGFTIIAEATGVPPEDSVSFGTQLVLRAAVLF